MTWNVRSTAVAAYLFLCVVVGGSAQGTWGNLALQLLGLALIAWAAIAASPTDAVRASPAPYLLLLATLLIVGAQLIPLPASLWTQLPGRQALSTGFEALGEPRPALSISEAPFTSLMTLFAAIPAIAAFIATERLRPSPRMLAIAVIAATLAAVFFGAMQVGGGRDSWAYLYRFTNEGAVGFFANQNHMATLLLVAIPLTMVLIYSSKSESRSSPAGRYWTGIVILALLLAGVALNGSLAAYTLALPVLLASLALAPAAVRWRRFLLPVSAVAFGIGVLLLASAPITAGADHSQVSASVTSRTQIWRTTLASIEQSFPVGTGLGTFEQTYRQQEDPLAVTGKYVNHAHNDYLEFVADLGAAGALLIGAFLLWWGITAVGIWRSHLGTPIAKASTIVTAAVLVHSLVDFPLRTAAISAIFAACLALMAQRSPPPEHSRDSRPARHVKLG